MLESLEIKDKKTLFVLNETDMNIYLVCKKFPGAKVLRADSLNTYDILNANKMMFVESSLKSVEAMFSNK